MKKAHEDGVIEKLDRIDSRLDNIEIVLTGQAKDIQYHIKRTDMLEAELKPISKSWVQLMGIVKFIASLAVIAGSIEAAKILIKYF